MKRMDGWNRLFVVAAVCWVLVAPFLFMAEVNRPVDQAFNSCVDFAYRMYGASDSFVRLDMEKFHEQRDKCISTWMRTSVSIPKLLGALVGTAGDPTLTSMAWGFILIPPLLLWIVGAVIGKTVRWVAAGFRQGGN